MIPKKLTVSAPGRICLFGEHQDYLGLPVISAAINLRISIHGEKRNDGIFRFDLPDVEEADEIDPALPIQYKKKRDYIRSCFNILLRQNIRSKTGYNCRVSGNIPINSGTSSSTALTVALIGFLLTTSESKYRNDSKKIAQLAHRAEVLEFNEPGGMMDHYTASFGSLLFIDFSAPAGPVALPARLGRFVLGDSGESKNTTDVLARVKNGVREGLEIISGENSSVSMKTITCDDLKKYGDSLSPKQYELLNANIVNRELTKKAKTLLLHETVEPKKFGSLLTAHHRELRDKLGISTPKIDRMIDAALESGAFGAKINGSGGGGCMFAYAPENYERVAEAIARADGKPYIVTIDNGVRIEQFV